ncbi:YraN family protein [Pedobacter yulinensis]|uniref:UPF0102 protein C7T94_00910 n=1 Tax=Pedobacter yulinensis TaxID=2126353 RepID=A0A2T3HQI0_9SPHI|nr:YraN family protein [Pedobacter yulinensis]PST84725.1 YraN family protein [Pedobacter yulinensis]
MAIHNDRGKDGEVRAAFYLQQAGYEILDANWRAGHDEIDLVASLDGKLIFVEVKCRSNVSFGEPEDFVTLAKQRRLARAANAYITAMSHKGEIRFDIVAVTLQRAAAPVIRHIEDAFWPVNNE